MDYSFLFCTSPYWVLFHLVLQHLKTALNSDPVLPCSCMPISMTPPSHLKSIISVAPMKPIMTRVPSLPPPISCEAPRNVQWISFSLGLWLKFLEFHMESESIAALWVPCEGTQKTLAKSEYRTSFSSLVGSSVRKQRAGGSDRISSWQVCVPATYHLLSSIGLRTAHLFHFFQKLQLEWLLPGLFRFLFFFLLIYHYMHSFLTLWNLIPFLWQLRNISWYFSASSLNAGFHQGCVKTWI